MHRSVRASGSALVVAAAAGSVVGALTSLGQSLAALNGTLNPFVNSASAWLVLPFLLAAAFAGGRRTVFAAPPRAAGVPVGLTACVCEVVGYYVVAAARGYSAGSAAAVWALCALVGGPLLGLAGQAWRRGDLQLAGAVLPASFLAEATLVYAIRLGALDRAALWAGCGILAAALLLRRWTQLPWLLVAFAGFAAAFGVADALLAGV